MCNHCGGNGIIRVCYHDGSPTDYAVCLCSVGLKMRDETNAGKRTGYALWQVWAYRNQVQPERVAMLEELLSDEELVAAGFQATGAAAPASDDYLVEIGRTRKAARL